MKMIFTTKNNREVELRKLGTEDLEKLAVYLQNLSPETKSRFGPHGFKLENLKHLFLASDEFFGFIAEETYSSDIIAYSVIKNGVLEHDRSRLESYGMQINSQTDYTFAPSVADAWQSQGVGIALYNFLLIDLKLKGFRRIILWGGVQAGNEKALGFYQKLGFESLGQFEYNGWNYDMIKEI
jgi:diamine N-acetyltransferase